MPTFDEVKKVSFTPEQADTVIAALVVHLKRMKRHFQGVNIKIAKALADGEKDKVTELIASNDARLKRIAETRKELDRLRELFPEVNNANAEN